jgi:hypothetical protein
VNSPARRHPGLFQGRRSRGVGRTSYNQCWWWQFMEHIHDNLMKLRGSLGNDVINTRYIITKEGITGWFHKLREFVYIKLNIFRTTSVSSGVQKWTLLVSVMKYFIYQFYLSLWEDLVIYPPSLFQHVLPSAIAIIDTIHSTIYTDFSWTRLSIRKKNGWHNLYIFR